MMPSASSPTESPLSASITTDSTAAHAPSAAEILLRSETVSPGPVPLPSPTLTDPTVSPKSAVINAFHPNTAGVGVDQPVLDGCLSLASTTSETLPTRLPLTASPTSSTVSLSITEYSTPSAGKAMKKRCRTVMTPHQSRVLRRVLEQTAFPSTEMRESLARLLGMKPRTVQIWFQNQRQKSRQGGSIVMPSHSVGFGRSNSVDTNSSSSSNDCNTLSSIGPNVGSSSGSSSTRISPAIAALSVSDAPSNGYQEQSEVFSSSSQQQTRWTRFHGATFNMAPGHGAAGPTQLPVLKRSLSTGSMSTHSPGNASTHTFTATSTSTSTSAYTVSGPARSASCDSLDMLASVVAQQSHLFASNDTVPVPITEKKLSAALIRPNGYNYYAVPANPTANCAPLERQLSPNLRLAPLRSSSPPSDESSSSLSDDQVKLPPLKALAQVAAVHFECHGCGPIAAASNNGSTPLNAAFNALPLAISNKMRPW